MPAGLTVRNGSGYLQITDSLKGFVFHSKGVVNLSGTHYNALPGSSVEWGAYAQISIPNTFGFPPIMAFRCAVPITVLREKLVGGNWVITVCSETNITPLHTDPVEWYAFQPCPDTPPGENFGLEVRDATGKLCFHSGYRPMRIADVQKEGVGSGNFVLPAGRKLALCLMDARVDVTAQIPAGAWFQVKFISAIRTTADNVGDVSTIRAGHAYYATNFGFGAGTMGKWEVMAIDVTGY